MTSPTMRTILCAGALLTAGCSPAFSPEHAADPRAAIRAAAVLGAYDNPRAALHLKYAQDQVARAEALLRLGEEEEAAWVLLKAEADAELALVLAKEQKVRAEVLAVRRQILELERRRTPAVRKETADAPH